MTRIIMHGCNGHMGQVITGIVANDANAQIVAGIDLRDDGHNLYPVFASLEECNVEADVIIDFASAKAEDTLVDYIKKTKIPAVICTTGLSDEQIASIMKHQRVLQYYVQLICHLESIHYSSFYRMLPKCLRQQALILR